MSRKDDFTRHVITKLDGSPITEMQDDCPLCMMLRESGQPVHTVNLDGSIADDELPHRAPPEAIDVTYVGDDLVAEVLGPEPKAMYLPIGCKARDFLAALRFLEPHLTIAFPLPVLGIQVNGKLAAPMQRLHDGDVVVITASAIWRN